ncbi:hypothetical protein [Georgenia ruanii]|uniref:hypothetical protein n=1 Tax=Georgenia ruanii TaxID=348442 RepID=UPI003CD07041
MAPDCAARRARPQVAASIDAELRRSRAARRWSCRHRVRRSPITYAEGYPGRSYYGGCEHVNVSEQLTIDPARRSSTPVRQHPAPLRRPSQTPRSYAPSCGRATRSSAWT